ncbi:MAG: hypothetical protein KDC03_23825 [Flavobacteriales bacterium]|nr:hypothetical protein [Flavobacteriales bacterium]
MLPRQVVSAARRDMGSVKQQVAIQAPHLWVRGEGRSPDAPYVDLLSLDTGRYMNWFVVATSSRAGVTLFPLLWYFTTEGLHAVQVDDRGPALYYQPHALDRVLGSAGSSDIVHALREFHHRNYLKAFTIHPYKGDPEACVAVCTDGYLPGSRMGDSPIISISTFYDLVRGRRRFGDVRQMAEWAQRLTILPDPGTPRISTPITAWGRGYSLPPALRRAA